MCAGKDSKSCFLKSMERRKDSMVAYRSCGGCNTTFVSLDSGVPTNLKVVEGKLAALGYTPAGGPVISTKALPDCPHLPAPGPPPGPPAPGLTFESGGFKIGLRAGSWAIQTLGYVDDTRYGKNFSFVPPLWSFYPNKQHRDHPGAHHVGDVTVRVQPLSETNESSYSMYSSARGGIVVNATPVTGNGNSPNVVAQHDITAALNAPGQLDTRHPLGKSSNTQVYVVLNVVH